MKDIIRYASLVALVGLASCATPPEPRQASLFLLSTNKSVTALMDEIASELEKNKYNIEKKDPALGMLVTEPRKFVILRGQDRTYGEMTFQMRQEGGSVKIRLTYLCESVNGFSPCMSNDQDANYKIQRLEKLILAMVNRKLYKKPGTDRVKSREI